MKTHVTNSNSRAHEAVLITKDKIDEALLVNLSADAGIENSVDFMNQEPPNTREYELWKWIWFYLYWYYFYLLYHNLENEQDVKFSYDKLVCKEAVDSV